MSELGWEYQQAAHGPWHDLRGHIPFLRECVTMPAPVIIECGVRRGRSTRAFLLAASNRDGQVWSVDLAPPDVPPVIRDHPRWHFLQADDLSSEAQAWLPASCDVLFLDAHDDDWTVDQLIKHVLAELEAYVPRVRPGGLVLAHDTQWEPRDTDLGAPVGGVAQALDIYCADTGLEWSNRPGYYGLGVLRIPPAQAL